MIKKDVLKIDIHSTYTKRICIRMRGIETGKKLSSDRLSSTFIATNGIQRNVSNRYLEIAMRECECRSSLASKIRSSPQAESPQHSPTKT